MGKPLYWIYLALAAAGLVTAWIFNALAVMNGEDYGQAWTATAVDLVLTYDLGIVAFAGVIFMFVDSKVFGFWSPCRASQQWLLCFRYF